MSKNSQKNDSISPPEGVNTNVRFDVSTSIDLKRSNQPSVPDNVMRSGFEKMKMADPKSPKSAIMTLPPRSHLITQTRGGKLPSFRMSIASKNHIRSGMVGGVLMRKEQESSRFLSVSVNREKLTGGKATEPSRQGLPWHSKETKRLSFTKKLQLFRALSKKPLPFLDLHVRFGVSKHTIRGLVRNGFLVEAWGSNDIGVQFKLTRESKNRLKEMEATARYNSRIAEKSPIRLKNKT